MVEFEELPPDDAASAGERATGVEGARGGGGACAVEVDDLEAGATGGGAECGEVNAGGTSAPAPAGASPTAGLPVGAAGDGDGKSDDASGAGDELPELSVEEAAERIAEADALKAEGNALFKSVRGRLRTPKCARWHSRARARRRGRRCVSRSLVHSDASAHVDGRNRSRVLTHARTRPRVVQGDFAGARERYSAALAAAPAARGAGAAALAAARAVYHANRAAAALQAGDARTARDDCDASLRLAPGAPKVLMRRARALEALEEVEAAHADAQAAADAAEDNSAIQKDAKGARAIARHAAKRADAQRAR